MKIYKTVSGLIEREGQFYRIEDDWDAFINRDELYQYAASLTERLSPVGITEISLAELLSVSRIYLVLIKSFSRNPRKEVTKIDRIYFWDLGIRNAVIDNFDGVAERFDKGALFENFVYTYFSGIDYSSHFPPNLNSIPPDELQDAWARDYSTMQKEMIYGHSLAFGQLLDEIKKLLIRINSVSFD